MFLSRVRLKPDIGSNSQLGQLLRQRAYGTHQLLWDLFDGTRRDFLVREEVAKEQLGDRAGARGEPLYYILSAEAPKADTPLFDVETKRFAPALRAGQRLAFRLRVNPVVTRNRQRHDLVMDEQLALYRRICTALGQPDTGGKGDLLPRLKQATLAPALLDWLCSYLAGTRYEGHLNSHRRPGALLDLAVQEAVSGRLATWLTEAPSRAGVFELGRRTFEDEAGDRTFEVPDFQWSGYRTHPLPEKGPRARFLSVDLAGQLIVRDPERFEELLRQGIGPAKAFGCGLLMIRPVS